MGQAKYFTTLDLKLGYWQIKVDAKSQGEDSISNPSGIVRIPCDAIWCKDAPAVFQHLMQSVSKGLKTENLWMHTYLDDVIIFSTTLDQHIRHIQEVLECFEKANLN